MTMGEANQERACSLAPRQHLLQGDNLFLISELRERVGNRVFWINWGLELVRRPTLPTSGSNPLQTVTSQHLPGALRLLPLLFLASGLCSVPGTQLLGP